MSAQMTEMNFERIAQSYGGALERWPVECRIAAKDFLKRNPNVAHSILDAQNDVDQALAYSPIQHGTSALESQILRSFPVESHKTKTGQLWPGVLHIFERLHSPSQAVPAWSMALALMLICGFAGGYSGYAYSLEQSSSTEILASAFGNDEPPFYVEDAST